MPSPRNPRPGHLRATRLRLGLSQERVGVLAGLSSPQKQVSNVERGGGINGWRAAHLVMKALMRVLEEQRAERWMIGHRSRKLAEYKARIARQEALWNALPDSPAKAALLDAMLDRCFDLMCEGNGEACDAIAEWLPPDRVEAMFDAWERWSEGDDSPSGQAAEPSGTGTSIQP